MNIEKVLYEYPTIKSQLSIDEIRLNNLRRTELTIKATKFDGIKVDSSDVNNVVEKEVLKRLEEKEKIEGRCKTNRAFIKLVDTALLHLDKEEKKLVELKYFDNKSVFDICNRLGFSNSTYVRKRKSALEKLDKILKAPEE